MSEDKIKPALSPDEWASVRNRYSEIRSASYVLDCEDDIFAKVAVANWLMDDDDPRKLVRADVDHIEWTCEQMRKLNPISFEDEARLELIAAKLAALLPPAE